MLRRFTPRNDKAGFTLAEVLITLVIIGIIAALTIPNLLQKYQEQATVKKVQKFYSNLSNAYSLAIKENGTASEWGLTGFTEESAIKVYELLLKPYFKIAKDCGVDNSGNCIARSYKKLKNENTGYFAGNKNYYKITLEDGAAVWCRGDNGSQYSAEIHYDINGLKEPNQYGKDTFIFSIRNDKMVPNGIQSGKYSYAAFNSYCQYSNQSNYSGSGCTAWVVYKGNMDYLHCDLTWDKHSCKDK